MANHKKPHSKVRVHVPSIFTMLVSKITYLASRNDSPQRTDTPSSEVTIDGQRRKAHAKRRKHRLAALKSKKARDLSPTASQRVLDRIDNILEDLQDNLTCAVVSSMMRQASTEELMKESLEHGIISVRDNVDNNELCTAFDFLRMENTFPRRQIPIRELTEPISPISPMAVSPISPSVKSVEPFPAFDRTIVNSPTSVDRLSWRWDATPPSSRSMCTADLTEDERTEIWLERGMPSPVREAEEQFRLRNKIRAQRATSEGQSSVFTQLRDSYMSLVPPYQSSPTSQFSSSPLNNGRDMYGNLLPTSVQAYFGPQSPLQSERTCSLSETSEHSEVYLRGGGWGYPWQSTATIDSANTRDPKRRPSSASSRRTLGTQAMITRSYATNTTGRSDQSLQLEFPTPRRDHSYRATRTDKNLPGVPAGSGAASSCISVAEDDGHDAGSQSLPQKGYYYKDDRQEFFDHAGNSHPTQQQTSSSKFPSTDDKKSVHNSHRRKGKIFDKDILSSASEHLRRSQKEHASELFSIHESDEPYDESIISEYAAPDSGFESKSLREAIETSGPYQDFQRRLRERTRVDAIAEQNQRGWYGEPERLAPFHAQQDQNSDIDTLHPGDSVTITNPRSPLESPLNHQMRTVHETTHTPHSPAQRTLHPPTVTILTHSHPSSTNTTTPSLPKSSLHHVLHAASRLSRLLLAAPSSPTSKTFSSRNPPASTLKASISAPLLIDPNTIAHDFAAFTASPPSSGTYTAETRHEVGATPLPPPLPLFSTTAIPQHGTSDSELRRSNRRAVTATATASVAGDGSRKESEDVRDNASRTTTSTRWPEPVPRTQNRDYAIPHAKPLRVGDSAGSGMRLRGGGGGDGEADADADGDGGSTHDEHPTSSFSDLESDTDMDMDGDGDAERGESTHKYSTATLKKKRNMFIRSRARVQRGGSGEGDVGLRETLGRFGSARSLSGGGGGGGELSPKRDVRRWRCEVALGVCVGDGEEWV